MAEPMLSVYNINVWYGAIHAIKDISFNVNEGEIVALIGANGAGKSTTLKTVSGLLRSKTGSIKFMGEDITHTPADKLVGKGLAQVPEGRRAFLQMRNVVARSPAPFQVASSRCSLWGAPL